MARLNKLLTLKYVLAVSVFEALNKVAYATQARALGLNQNTVNTLISHSTFCDMILPLLIGSNKNSNNWESEKHDYMNSLQISVPASGLKLNLNGTLDRSNITTKENLENYIKENKLDKGEYEKDPIEDKELLDDIMLKLAPIELHKYIKFDDIKHYLYWVVCVLSAQVANNPEDVKKSPNIRFFIFDDKVAQKEELKVADLQVKASNKLQSVREGDKDKTILRNIALVNNVLTFAELEDISDNDVYLKLFKYGNEHPEELLKALENKDIMIQGKVKQFIEVNIFRNEDNGSIVETSNPKNVIGTNMNEVISYFKNPINQGDITKFETAYKSLKK